MGVSPLLWPLQERAGFLPWVADAFAYSDSDSDSDGGGAAGPGEARTLFAQQKFVRDYLQHASPYRGLLLLHSLGVGKTCAALAAAEALRPTSAAIYVFLTKMLRNNFVDEVPPCVRPDLLRNQRWALVPAADPRAARYASSLPPKMVRAHGGVYVPAPDPDSSRDEGEYRDFKDLDTGEQARINAQVEAYVSSTFRFVHYNGLTQQRVSAMVSGGKNPFDSSVVIIDEVHNFISLVMNRKLVTPLYERMLDAVDCRVILLSGTPIVNRIAELAYIVNLIQGRQRVHELRLRGETTQESVDEALRRLRGIRRAVYDPDGRTVSVALAPRGFEVVQGPGMPMLRRVNAEDVEDVEDVARALKKRNIAVAGRSSRAALPLPDDPDVFDAHFVDREHGALLNPGLLQRRIAGAISSYARKDPALFARVADTELILSPLSDRQFIKYAAMRHEERRREERARVLQARVQKGRKSPADESSSAGQLYRTFSLALCTFAFPDEVERPVKFRMRYESPDEDPDSLDRAYEEAMRRAVDRIKAEKPECLLRDGLLREHSPKFAELLDRLDAATGTALVYSRFRRAEGLGLLAAALDMNGWRELVLQWDGDAWVYPGPDKDEADVPKAGVLKNPPRHYVVLRSDADPSYNRVLMQIFNDEMDALPTRTRTSLARAMTKSTTATGLSPATTAAASPTTASDKLDKQPTITNLRGQIARAIMITGAGAEGISLKNVRQVHMLESYWNSLRMDQVVGRAVRARSHLALPEAERTVDVFLYLSTFRESQRELREILNDDKGLTSDEYVYAIAMRKKQLTDQAMSLIRAAAVDCRVHARTQEELGACLRLPANIAPGDEYRTMAFEDDRLDADVAKSAKKLVAVQVAGVKYYLDRESGILYDYAKLRAGEGLVEAGRLDHQ